MATSLVPKIQSGLLPPILAGNTIPVMRQRVHQFFSSLASLFESWVSRRKSVHTQRAYREDVTEEARKLALDRFRLLRPHLEDTGGRSGFSMFTDEQLAWEEYQRLFFFSSLLSSTW